MNKEKYLISVAGSGKWVMLWQIEGRYRTRIWWAGLDKSDINPDGTSKYIFLPETYTLEMAIAAAKLLVE